MVCLLLVRLLKGGQEKREDPGLPVRAGRPHREGHPHPDGDEPHPDERQPRQGPLRSLLRLPEGLPGARRRTPGVRRLPPARGRVQAVRPPGGRLLHRARRHPGGPDPLPRRHDQGVLLQRGALPVRQESPLPGEAPLHRPQVQGVRHLMSSLRRRCATPFYYNKTWKLIHS